STMYNALNMAYTQEWGPLGPSALDSTVYGASVSSFLCPSDGITNTCSGDTSAKYPLGNFNYVGNTGHPRNVLLPGDAPNGGNLPQFTGIMSLDRMYAELGACGSAASAATTNVTVRLQSVTDGTSNTAAISESLMNDGSGKSNDIRRLIGYTNAGLVEQA